jgi:Helicase associated domain
MSRFTKINPSHSKPSWYDRLNDLVVYRKKFGNSKFVVCEFPRICGVIAVSTSHHHYRSSALFCLLANVPQKYPENRPLGIWVNKQRMEKKCFDLGQKAGMTSFRVKLLESVGFVWAKKKGEHAWQERYNELVVYRQKNGNCTLRSVTSS